MMLIDLLADNNFGDTRSGDGPAGPVPLLLILLLAVVTIFLIRNMNQRLKRLPTTFDAGASGGKGDDETPVTDRRH